MNALLIHQLNWSHDPNFQIARVRDMERELNYLREESENILTIRESLPNFCPKSNELCLEDQC